MEFKFRAIDEQASTYIPPPSSFSYFTEQALRAGYQNTDYGRAAEFFRNPSDVREAIQRELEKERIREEIIATEIARKRVLEAEVRREMLMEREMALRRVEGFSFLSAAQASSAMRFEPRLSILHQSDGRSLEERLALSLEERLGYSARREIGGFETLAFQRNVEPKISEVKPLSEVSKEKVILMAKPDGNLSGAKRKAVTPPAVGASEFSSGGSKKKPKEEWSCAMCQVSATSERGLNEHLQGKKHKAREAGLRAQRTGKNFAIGLFPKKTGKPKLAEVTDNPSSEQGKRVEGESLQVKKNGALLRKRSNTEEIKRTNELLLQISQDAHDSKKNNGDTEQKGQKTGEYKKKRFKFWCEMCQIGAYSEKVMDTHKKGKKHVGRVQEVNQNGGSAPATQTAAAVATQDAKDAEVATQEEKDAQVVSNNESKETSEIVVGAADGVEVEVPANDANDTKW